MGSRPLAEDASTLVEVSPAKGEKMAMQTLHVGDDGWPLMGEVVGHGELIIMPHGGGPGHHSMRPVADRLAGRYRVALPDIRGYGASRCPDPTFTAGFPLSALKGPRPPLNVRGRCTWRSTAWINSRWGAGISLVPSRAMRLPSRRGTGCGYSRKYPLGGMPAHVRRIGCARKPEKPAFSASFIESSSKD